jgi:GxxExxY protein
MMNMENLRNFCIIAHIDHGKSTLADRLLEMTKTVEKRQMKEQLLDQMDLERERGITIKLQPAAMLYKSGETEFQLNLIDTPGHVDFGYEVSRSLAAVEGAILLVDSTQGVQAQTMANLYQAIEQDLEIIPVVNKIDLPNSDVAKTKQEIIQILGCKEEEILPASGKTGEGVEAILEAIVEKVPPPEGQIAAPLRAMIFDSKYDSYKGVLAYVRVVDGSVKSGEKIKLMIGGVESEAMEVGKFSPSLVNTGELQTGEIGYIATGLKSVKQCRVGDTVTSLRSRTHADRGADLRGRQARTTGADDRRGQRIGLERGGLLYEELTYKIRGAAFKVKKELGLGHKEKVYHNALKKEFTSLGVRFESEKQLPVKYKGEKIGVYQPDFIIDDKVIVELKALPQIGRPQQEQLWSYLKGGDYKLALMINFGSTDVDFKRIVYDTAREKNQSASGPRQSAASQLNSAVVPLEGYKKVAPMVYASFYPTEGEDYNQMRDALEKLQLNDAALTFEGESSPALGRGFRIGFLGLLHLEIIKERLRREFEFEPVITTPGVVYEVVKTDGESYKIYAAAEMPEANIIKEIREPRVKLEVVSPSQYLGPVLELVSGSTRAEYLSTEYLDQDRVLLAFDAPLSEVVVNLHDNLKSATSGFASFSYEITGYRAADLVRMDVYVAEEKVDAFSQIIPKVRVMGEGRRIVKKLKEVIPRQNFQVKIQAAIGGKVIARENISAFRKDVTGHLYGGDVTRKRKLLEKQRKGKKRMASGGRVEIPQEAFMEILKK